MDGDFSISYIGQRQAPVLMATGNLVQKLGVCMLYSSSQSAATIRLKGSQEDGMSPPTDLGSELDRIANDGLDAFTEANEFLKTVQYTAGSIARRGGPLETLQTDYGIPEARETNKKLLERMEKQISDCFEDADSVVGKFTSWQTQTKALLQEIRKAYARKAQAAEDLHRDISDQTEEIQNKVDELEGLDKAEQSAQAKHAQSVATLDRHLRQSALNNCHIPKSLNLMDCLWSVVTVAQAGWSWYSSKAAASVVRDMQREFEGKRRIAEDYRTQLRRAEASLSTQTRKGKELDRYTAALESTVNALNLLTQDVRCVLVEFKEMKVITRKLVEGHRDGLAKNAGEAGETVNEYEIKHFRNDALEMRRWAIMVEHLAWLYADTIKGVMIQGFQGLQAMPRTSGRQGDEVEARLLLEGPGSGQELYRQENNNSCVSLVTTVDQSFRGSCERLDRVQIIPPPVSRQPAQEADPGNQRRRPRFFARRSR